MSAARAAAFLAGLQARYLADIAATVTDLLAAAGPEATLCVLPQGPQTIPYLG